MTGVDKIIHDILQREGSEFTDKPADRGGPTKYGITLATLTRWRKCTVTIDDVRMLTESEAETIYKNEYIILPGFANLRSQYLQELVVDAGVNHGVREATILLQRAVGAPEDGELGLTTLKLLGSLSEAYVWFRFMGYRLRYYAAIIKDSPAEVEFAQGWFNRCINLLAQHSAEMVLQAHARNDESQTALNLASQFASWSKNLYPLEMAKANAYGTFIRAGGDCLTMAARFNK